MDATSFRLGMVGPGRNRGIQCRGEKLPGAEQQDADGTDKQDSDTTDSKDSDGTDAAS